MAAAAPWRPLEYRVLFGVLGGLGPMATAEFARQIVLARVALFRAMMDSPHDPVARLERVRAVSTAEWTQEDAERVWGHTQGRIQLRDQDHVPLLIAQATTVPPRPTFILGITSDDPTQALVDCARGLVNAGATHLALVCNTAHYFWSRVEATLQRPDVVFVDMIALSVLRARKLSGGPRPVVGLLATEATLQVGIYQDVARKFGVGVVSPFDLPNGQEQYAKMHEVIFGDKGIKAGFDSPDKNQAGLATLLTLCLTMMQTLEISVLVVGCTELPLLLNDASVQQYASSLLTPQEMKLASSRLQLVDPSAVLADHVLHLTLCSRMPADAKL